ncbi:MAG TPA: endolytic transglycosylase MltG [Candidatus Hydrogenedentes bacterium]|nr:endolytic transglycosylase MltG [Candidatus Hydrogenedentota bacterium]
MERTPEARAPRKRVRPWRLLLRLAAAAFVLVIVASVAAAVFAYLIYNGVTQPGAPGEAVDVVIPAGATGRDVGVLLQRKGLVEHHGLFRLAVKLDSTGKAIKHGPYALHRGLSPVEFLHILQNGPNRSWRPDEIPSERKITVPEGLTIAQTAKLFDHPEAFIAAASDSELIARLDIKAKTLEGFLMPDTYFFDVKPTEREVVERMVSHFGRVYAELVEEFPESASRSKLELATVASLIEEEARVDGERAKVAAVIYNRIEKSMPLQMDSTLQYALGKYGERMLHEDKEVDSPYNTYKRAGLPPGPISSAGVASWRAAMNPADEDYLYFVSNADGKTHSFSTNEADHLRAVREYRRAMAVQRENVNKGDE